MTANNSQKPEVQWDQSAFEALRATWSARRIQKDEKRLQKVFNLAADIPRLKEALDWANAHGVKIFIDHTATGGVGGYYMPGTGVVGIAEKALAHSPVNSAAVIVHEIRHVWQNYHGLSVYHEPTAIPGDFAETFIRNSLGEADAYAFGQMARYEGQAAALKKRKKIPPALLPPADPALKKEFLSWFSSVFRLEFYGDYSSKVCGRQWGVYKGELPEIRLEFKIATPSALADMDIGDIQDILRLGKGFSGAENYLAGLSPDVLPRKILVPSLANTFWGAANDDQKKLTTDIRKACLRKKLAHRLREPQA